MKQRNIVLDFLRILAAVEIFLMHLTLFVPEEVGNQTFAFLSKISSRGANGVAILFCLSGYLIFSGLFDGGTDWKTYFRKRIMRIVPVYYLVLMLYLAVGLLPRDAGVLRYFFFVNGLVPSGNYAVYNNVGGFWSMGCFLLWYLIAPWLARRVKSLRTSLVMLAGMFVAGKIIKLVLRVLYIMVNADAIDFMVDNNPFGNLYFFGTGVVAYFLIKEAKSTEGIFVCMLGITFLTVINSPWYFFWMLLAVVFILLSGQVEISLPYGKRCIAFLSDISFALYLVHLGVIELMDATGIQDSCGSLVFAVVTTAVVFLCTMCVYAVDRFIFQRLLFSMEQKSSI